MELAVLIGVALLGIASVKAPNLEPFAPMGYAPFIPAMALIYISYVGFELITVASEEIINPGKTIPRAILITLLIGIVIYVFNQRRLSSDLCACISDPSDCFPGYIR